jgi:hypothetical protein
VLNFKTSRLDWVQGRSCEAKERKAKSCLGGSLKAGPCFHLSAKLGSIRMSL